jgi:RNA polymerase sigma factor (sigma-70 family)
MIDSLESFRGLVSYHIRDVKSKLDIDDVIQDAAIDILKSGGKATAKNVIWTSKAARKKAWRDSRRDHVRLVTGENPNQEFSSDPLAAMIAGEELQALSAAFARMDSHIEMVVKMRFYEQRTYQEIGKAFGCSGTWAANMVKAGLEELRTAIGGEDE